MRTGINGTINGAIRITFDGSHGAIDFSTLTFAQLKGLLSPTTGQDIPTAKALREGDAAVLVQAMTEDEGTLTVFRSGFFSYATESGRVTVYGVDRCSRLTLSGSDGWLPNEAFEDMNGEDALFGAGENNSWIFSEEHFGDCLWAKVLEFAASERVAGNINRDVKRQEVQRLDDIDEDWDMRLVVPADFETRMDDEETRIEESMQLKSALARLTDRQREVLRLRYPKSAG